MSIFEFNKRDYNWKVNVPGAFGIVASLAAIVQLLVNPSSYVWYFILLVGAYTAINAFVSLSNPEIVEIRKNKLVFKAHGKVHEYDLRKIESYRVKEFHQAKKLFIRIDDAGMLKGRYWVNCYYFNNRDELYRSLVELEYRIDPSGLKSMVKRSHQKA